MGIMGQARFSRLGWSVLVWLGVGVLLAGVGLKSVFVSESQLDDLSGMMVVGKYHLEVWADTPNGMEGKVIKDDVMPTSKEHVYQAFGELYPELIDSTNSIYVQDIKVVRDTAEVLLAGSDAALIAQMGSLDARSYVALVIYSLTEDPHVPLVDLQLQQDDGYFSVGVFGRKDFQDFVSASSVLRTNN